jgi:D-glycero-beta-D-manno-heptose-7-phosphate kinase
MNTALHLPSALLPAQEELARHSVLVLGDAMLDRYWYGTVERISPEAPVPVLRVERQDHRPGGAANVALNVRTLGVRATLLAACGDDEPGRLLQHLLTTQGVDARLERDTGAQTLVKLRTVGRAQQLLRLDFEAQPCAGTLARLREHFDTVLLDHDAVVLADYGKGCLTDPATTRALIAVARAHGRPVLVDPNGPDWERYTGASMITPNRAQLAQAMGAWSSEAQLHERAFALRQRLQLESLLLTRSHEGMILFDAQGALHVAARASEVFDVTGAGDTVIATLAALMSCGLSARAAVPLANRAGGIVVGKFGTAAIRHAELMA